MMRIEPILGILKDTEKAMRASLSDIVPGGQVDTFLASKALTGQAYDHSSNDCETAANMCQEFIDLMSVNHARAKTFTELLQRCLMVSTQLQAVESYESPSQAAGTMGSHRCSGHSPMESSRLTLELVNNNASCHLKQVITGLQIRR